MKLQAAPRNKETGDRIYVIAFTQQEFDDLQSAMGLACPAADYKHKDSPKFRRALHKLERDLWRTVRDADQREKQRTKSNAKSKTLP